MRFLRYFNFWNAFLLLFLLSISTPAKSNQTQSISDTAYGFWTLENNTNSFRFAIKSNNGFAKIFLLGGDWSEISSQLGIFPHRGKVAAITDSFMITNANVTIPFIGQKEVNLPYAENGKTKIVEQIYYLPAMFERGKLELQLSDGRTLLFRKMNFSEIVFEYISLIFSTLTAIVLLLVALLTYARVGGSRVAKMLSAKRDRRYKEWGRLRGGGSYQSIMINILIGFGIIFFAHNFLLGFLGISGFTAHAEFWLF